MAATPTPIAAQAKKVIALKRVRSLEVIKKRQPKYRVEFAIIPRFSLFATLLQEGEEAVGVEPVVAPTHLHHKLVADRTKEEEAVEKYCPRSDPEKIAEGAAEAEAEQNFQDFLRAVELP